MHAGKDTGGKTRISLSLLLLLLAATVGAEQDVVKNGDFRRGLQDWRYHARDGFKEFTPQIQRVDGLPALVLNLPGGGPGDAVVLAQTIKPKDDETYELALDCQLEGSGRIRLRVNRNKKPWTIYGCNRFIQLEPEWTRYVVTFKSREVLENAPSVLRILLGEAKGKLQIRNISLREVPDRDADSDSADLKSQAITAAEPPPEPKKIEPNPEPQISPPQETPPPKPAKKVDDAVSARDLLRAFAENPTAATKQYEGQPIRLSGRVTNFQAALLGDVLLELEGGRMSILIAADAIDDLSDRMISSELSAAKRRITAFSAYAKTHKIPTAERRKRAVDALPTATLTATFIGFRDGSVKMRHGKNISVDKGEDLVPD
jgi:hypothetical protein